MLFGGCTLWVCLSHLSWMWICCFHNVTGNNAAVQGIYQLLVIFLFSFFKVVGWRLSYYSVGCPTTQRNESTISMEDQFPEYYRKFTSSSQFSCLSWLFVFYIKILDYLIFFPIHNIINKAIILLPPKNSLRKRKTSKDEIYGQNEYGMQRTLADSRNFKKDYLQLRWVP